MCGNKFCKGFPAKIKLIGFGFFSLQNLDYENISFQCRNFMRLDIPPNLVPRLGNMHQIKYGKRPNWWEGASFNHSSSPRRVSPLHLDVRGVSIKSQTFQQKPKKRRTLSMILSLLLRIIFQVSLQTLSRKNIVLLPMSYLKRK